MTESFFKVVTNDYDMAATVNDISNNYNVRIYFDLHNDRRNQILL
ncbi:hypothetical protein SAMN05878482_104192 [Peribacillus simplex]|uniref:Uncharacterized protein n=1 Tax=Peribacillus simplex TaxID=1478 RepID=A0A9X8RA52_9BACI|nr:hypothetical protein SAMN05878482_104192 [Peribacillus simplex]